MTFKDKLTSERRWNKRVLLINFYHNMMSQTNKKWSQRLTARYLGISLGNVNESIKLCKAIIDDPLMEDCKSREEALIKLKQ